MVLEIKVPHGADFPALRPLLPVFLSYVLSFVYVGIYWNNHHHLLSSTRQISGGILWANLHLLFWLSLIPFATGWMGENHFAPATLAVTWRGAAGVSHRVFHPANCHRCHQRRAGFAAGAGAGARLEGQALASAVRDGYCQQLLATLAGGRGLRGRSASCGWCPTGALNARW
ncbi:MAG: TMEM175 family protein [Hymenobacter sp.]